jgi:hypothetical protein
MKPKVNVVLRACDLIVSVNKSPRPNGLDKKTLIKICFKSLYHALQTVPHTITVLSDNISEELISFFEAHGAKLITGVYGNDESIRQAIKIAAAFPPDEWVYICEDDYLHHENCFVEIATLIAERNNIRIGKRKHPFTSKLKFTYPELVIFPPDYPDRYVVKKNNRFYVFHTSSLHWRQVVNTTFTLMAEVKTIKKFEHMLLKSSYGADDGYLSRNMFAHRNFLGKCICVSPMPGLSTHMHINTMSPIVNWERLVEKYRKEIQ